MMLPGIVHQGPIARPNAAMRTIAPRGSLVLALVRLHAQGQS